MCEWKRLRLGLSILVALAILCPLSSESLVIADSLGQDAGQRGRRDSTVAAPGKSLTTDSFSEDAVLGYVVSGHPITYGKHFAMSFESVSSVDYSFVFSEEDALDTDECLLFSGGYFGESGFCNPGPEPVTSDFLVFPCSLFPDVCDAWLDGFDHGKIRVVKQSGGGGASIAITSLTITIHTDPVLLEAN